MKKFYAIVISLLCLMSALIAAVSQEVDKNDKQVVTQQPSPKEAKPEEVSSLSTDVPQEGAPDIYTIDSIKVVIFSPEGVEIITQSDLDRPGLTGTRRSLDEIVFEKLVFLDAKRHKITPDDDAVDKYLATVQKENNITLDELKDVFRSAGYTFEEGREQFKVMQAVNIMLDFKIRSNLVVPRKEIEAYYEQNPELKEARYQLEYALIPFEKEKKRDKQFTELEQVLASDKIEADIPWGKPFWVNHGDLAEEKRFICDMEVGQVCPPRRGLAGFEVYRLKNKEEERLCSLDERRLEIVDILRRPRYYQLLEEYKNTIFSTASIVYL